MLTWKGLNEQPVQIQDGGVRQTRLAFEARPSLLIYDDITRMLERMNCADISDDEEKESNDEVSDDAATGDENERKQIKALRSKLVLL